MIPLDAAWRSAHPLPMPTGETSKNSRGQVLVIGGARRVPGAVALTAEAALRVGAGKVRIATIDAAALPLGIAMPEIGVIGLREDAAGEIVIADEPALARTLERVDAVAIGPGMGDPDAAARVVRWAAARLATQAVLVLDGAAVACAGGLCDALAPLAGRLILTPHPGEMAALMACDPATVSEQGEALAVAAAERFGAALALKGSQTIVAAPRAEPLHYPGGGVGLATGGSGDVLAGAVAGLAARGASPVEALAWGVWLHGEAGRTLAQRSGPIGFLARELPPLLPALLPR
ncbi:NAD(P)H-hydrate dehydratase [Sphingomonas sp. CLY1604]|uniref:NAD(P)H-hydrate dehydratase n=1 Tax=Sphingomonas sp. CLY1604 TaxID=3457786 RepID=UPI003FD8B2C7